MFGLLTDAITETVDSVTGAGNRLLSGQLPTKKQSWDLLNTGMTIAGLAEIYGVSEEVIEGIVGGSL